MENKELIETWEDYDPHLAQQYRGLYYRYLPTVDVWEIYEDFYAGNLWRFNGKLNRIDECFHKIFNNAI